MPIKQPTRTYAETRAALRNPRGYIPGAKHEEASAPEEAGGSGSGGSRAANEDQKNATTGDTAVAVETVEAMPEHSTSTSADVLTPKPTPRAAETAPRSQVTPAGSAPRSRPSSRSASTDAEKPAPRRRGSKERRRVDIRLPVPADGVSEKLDVARAAHGDSKALLALLRRAWAELEADLLADRVETPPEPYHAGGHTVRTTRMIDADAYERARNIFDPHGVETDTGLAMQLGIAAVARYLIRHH